MDALHKGSSSIYDEYTYRLRSLYGVSDKIECSNGDELANVIYYWDRYYLNKTAFNTAMSANLYEQYASIKSCSQDYDAYLAAMLKSSLEYPFSEYIKDFSSKGNVPNYTDIKAPFINEYALQVRSFTDWLNSDEHGVSVSHMNDVSDALKFYEYLHDDTIIVYPFGWDKYYSSITLYAGAGDSMLNTATTFTSDKEKYEQVMAARIGQTISPIQTIMSLQKNTDFIRNSGVVTKPNLKKQTSKVTKEDLMNSALEFFKHPVTTLSYILTGFLYKVHEAVATGNLGSVFSLNYMLESDAYKWIMDRYISIITLALAVVLFLKLIQFALSKSKNFGHLGRSVIGIFAMCLVPVIVFNSFVWGINATSHWALSGVTNKMLLAQIDKYGTNVNNDANVTKEINAFKEQFAGIAGEWTTLQVQEIDKYSPVAGPSYNIKPVTSYTDNVRFSAADKLWYDTQNFVPVHMNRYSDSYFYYFYDYIKSTYYKYCVDNNKFEVSSFIEDYKTINDTNKLPSGDEASIKMVQNTENVLNTLQGHFIEMLYDTQYVYGNSINALYSSRYGGAQVKDLVGIYNIFSTDQLEFIKTLQSSKEFLALLDSDLMNVTSGSGAKYWANSDVIGEYVISQAAKQNGTRGDVNGKFPVMTSIHDAFNSNLNSKANSVDMSEKATSIILTPLEEKMCKVVTEIYDDTVASLEYLPDQIHDEAAISLMAFIATFKFNEAFGLEPVAPLEESIYLDTVVRTAFVTDLNMVASNTNALYAMIAEAKVIVYDIIYLAVCDSSEEKIKYPNYRRKDEMYRNMLIAFGIDDTIEITPVKFKMVSEVLKEANFIVETHNFYNEDEFRLHLVNPSLAYQMVSAVFDKKSAEERLGKAFEAYIVSYMQTRTGSTDYMWYVDMGQLNGMPELELIIVNPDDHLAYLFDSKLQEAASLKTSSSLVSNKLETSLRCLEVGGRYVVCNSDREKCGERNGKKVIFTRMDCKTLENYRYFEENYKRIMAEEDPESGSASDASSFFSS